MISLVWCLFDSVAVADDSQETFFRAKIEPILVGRCLECHGKERKGKLDLRSQATALKGGESGVAIVPGKPDESLLFEYLTDGEMPPGKPLPANEIGLLKRWITEGAYFPDRKLDLFSVTTPQRAGRDWWSFQPVRKVPVPGAETGMHARTPIDRFITSRLQREGLALSAPVDRRTLIRRVSYDLTGLLPDYKQVQDFVHDSRPDAYLRLVDRLLAGKQYGERWGRHWLDVVRFAESNGFERDRIRENFWRYRDYVIRSFNFDKPYDQFVREQLAGDALDPNNPEFLIATGFLVAGPKNDVPTISALEKLQTRQDELDEYVTATSTTFLGMTSGCARCHEHKFDPIDMRDYYGLTAVFSGLDRADNVVAIPQKKRQHAAAVAVIQKQIDAAKSQTALLLKQVNDRLPAEKAKSAPASLLAAVNFQRNEDSFKPVAVRFIRFVVTTTTRRQQPCLDELEVYGNDAGNNLALASVGTKATASSLLPGFKIHQIHHLNDGHYGNAHSWISNEPGKGWAQLELPETTTVQRVVWGRDREGNYRNRLPIRYNIDVSVDGKTWTQVSDSIKRRPYGKNRKLVPERVIAAFTPDERKRYQQFKATQKRLETSLKSIPPLPVSYSAKDTAPQPAYVLRRGDVRSRGEEVGPKALHAVSMLNASLAVGQNDSGPLRRLQLANWIVDLQNPLTARVFVNRVWHYHFGRGIVTTPNDFGFNGDRPSHPELLDWLADDFMTHGWRVKRLHRMIVLSETYRQASTYNSKAANKDGSNRLLWRMSPTRMDAESLRDAILQVSGKLEFTMGGPSFRLFDYRDGNVPDYRLLENPGPGSFRRAVYRFNIRTFQSPLMSAFDCPDPSVQTPTRDQSTTALQALSLMNNQFIFQQSRHFASRVTTIAGNDSRKQTVTAYRLALLRDPTEKQLQAAIEFINEHELFSLCRALLNSNEFLYVF
jgi:hypothetical protein